MTKSQLRVLAKQNGISLAAARQLANKQSISQRENLADEVRQEVLSTITPNGRNCVDVARATSEALTKRGIKNQAYVGWTTLNVGNGDNGITGHHPTMNTPGGDDDLTHHAWVQTDTDIIDLTTMTIPDSMDKLDALDGQKSDYQFAPEFIWAPLSANKSWGATHDTVGEFAFCYEPLAPLLADTEAVCEFVQALTRTYRSRGAAVAYALMSEVRNKLLVK